MFSYLGYVLIFMSILGYSILLFKKVNVKTELLPVIVFSSFIVILYFAALLNFMLIATLLLLIGGIITLIYFIFTKKLSYGDIKNIFSPGIIIFIICCIVIIIFYRNSTLISYDNFSHWALIVKQMWIDNRLPNFSNDLITFRSYPPGSALFIYFITTIVGKTEGNMLIAQNILSFSCMVTLFAFIRNKKNLISYFIIILSSFVLSSFSTGMNSLLVDSLLPLIGLAQTSIILYYKDDLKKAAILSLPLTCSTLLVKNSGIFFVIFNAIFILILFKINIDKNKLNFKKDSLVILGSIIIPFILLFLWSKHVKLVYTNDTLASSKHSMNLRYYIRTLIDKSSHDIKNICLIFFKRFIDITSRVNIVLISWNILLIVSYILFGIFNKQKSNKCLLYLICGDIVYLLYHLGLLGMYLFSMPLNESLVLASYERYASTILIYIIGIWLICLLKEILSSKNKAVRFKIIFSLFLCIFIGYNSIIHNVMKRIYPPSSKDNNIVYSLEKTIDDISNTVNKSFAIYCPSSSSDGGYSYYLTRYKLYTTKINLISSFEDKDEFYNEIKNYDYLLVLEEDENINEFLSPIVTNDVFIGGYEVKDILSIDK